MTIAPAELLEALKRVKGPDLQGNIVELGLVSEPMIRDDKVYVSITIDPSRADELEPWKRCCPVCLVWLRQVPYSQRTVRPDRLVLYQGLRRRLPDRRRRLCPHPASIRGLRRLDRRRRARQQVRDRRLRAGKLARRHRLLPDSPPPDRPRNLAPPPDRRRQRPVQTRARKLRAWPVSGI